MNLDWFFHDKGEMIKNYDSTENKYTSKQIIHEKKNDYNNEMTILRNDYIKTANKLIHALEENAQLKERLQKYEGADQ